MFADIVMWVVVPLLFAQALIGWSTQNWPVPRSNLQITALLTALTLYVTAAIALLLILLAPVYQPTSTGPGMVLLFFIASQPTSIGVLLFVASRYRHEQRQVQLLATPPSD